MTNTRLRACWSMHWSLKCVLKGPTNVPFFYGCNVIVLWSPTCFGYSCGHLQGGQEKNTHVIKMFLNHSTVWKWYITCYSFPPSQFCASTRIKSHDRVWEAFGLARARCWGARRVGGAVPPSVADCGLRGGGLEMLDKIVNRYSANPLVPVVSFISSSKTSEPSVTGGGVPSCRSFDR
jgi:hypothetical protein